MLSVGDSVAEPGWGTMPGGGDAIRPDIRGGKLSDKGPTVKCGARPYSGRASGPGSTRDAVLDRVTVAAQMMDHLIII